MRSQSSKLIMALLCAAPLALVACQSHEHPGEGAAGTGSSEEHPGNGQSSSPEHAGETSSESSEHPGN